MLDRAMLCVSGGHLNNTMLFGAIGKSADVNICVHVSIFGVHFVWYLYLGEEFIGRKLCFVRYFLTVF